jgi:hypothetical protein
MLRALYNLIYVTFALFIPLAVFNDSFPFVNYFDMPLEFRRSVWGLIALVITVFFFGKEHCRVGQKFRPSHLAQGNLYVDCLCRSSGPRVCITSHYQRLCTRVCLHPQLDIPVSHGSRVLQSISGS